MAVIAVDVQRVVPGSDVFVADIDRARVLARVLDTQFSILGVKFGLDPLLGLFPIVGDTLSLLAGLYPLYLSRKHHLGAYYDLRMIANLMLDYLVGIVPIAGDIFDVAFKANIKNYNLLRQAAVERGIE